MVYKVQAKLVAESRSGVAARHCLGSLLNFYRWGAGIPFMAKN
jgi:hypothetical protein